MSYSYVSVTAETLLNKELGCCRENVQCSILISLEIAAVGLAFKERGARRNRLEPARPV